jgi:hypothetical protein
MGFIPGRAKDFALPITSGLTLGITQPHIQWVLRAVSLGVKQQGCEAEHSPSHSAKVNNDGAILPLPTSSWYGT